MVTWPLTRGSMSMLRPVICAIAFTTAWRSACWKLSSTSPARGVTAAVPGARAPAGPGTPVGAGGTGATGGGVGSWAAAPWGGCSVWASGCCANAGCATSASAAASRCATERVAVLIVLSPARSSAHVVVEGFVASLALDLHQHALCAAELLIEAHDVLHAGERLPVDVPDHVAGAQAELFVETSGLDLAHQESAAGIGNDQRLAQELGLAELLLQLPAVDERSSGRARLGNGRRWSDQVGVLVEILERHSLAGAVAQDHDAVALHRVEPYARGQLLAGAERGFGLPLHDHQRAAGGGTRDHSRQREVEVGRGQACFGLRGRRGPEQLRPGQHAQVDRLRIAAGDDGRPGLGDPPGSLCEGPAQPKQRRDRRRRRHGAVREHGLEPCGRGNKTLCNGHRCRHRIAPKLDEAEPVSLINPSSYMKRSHSHHRDRDRGWRPSAAPLAGVIIAAPELTGSTCSAHSPPACSRATTPGQTSSFSTPSPRFPRARRSSRAPPSSRTWCTRSITATSSTSSGRRTSRAEHGFTARNT